MLFICRIEIILMVFNNTRALFHVLIHLTYRCVLHSFIVLCSLCSSIFWPWNGRRYLNILPEAWYECQTLLSGRDFTRWLHSVIDRRIMATKCNNFISLSKGLFVCQYLLGISSCKFVSKDFMTSYRTTFDEVRNEGKHKQLAHIQMAFSK